MCWNAGVQGELPGAELSINSGQAWLCGFLGGQGPPHTDSISGAGPVRAGHPCPSRAWGFRAGTGAPWPPGRHLCAQGWGTVPKALLPATPMEIMSQISFLESRIMAIGPGALSAQGRSSLLRTGMGNSFCRGFLSNCTFHTKPFG